MQLNYFKDSETFKTYFVDRVEKKYAVDFKDSTTYQQYVVLGEMVNEHVSDDWKKTNNYLKNKEVRQTYYFSMEFLMGRMITNNIMNAGIRPVVETAFKELGLDLNDVEHMEADAGLGNGGLGRLAACFMDSVASLGLPVSGNSIRYRYGFFDQEIHNGYQVERPDMWLKDEFVWETRKEDEAVEIPFFGYVEMSTDENGKLNIRHVNAEYVKAVPYDVPLIGNENGFVSTLRLWSAEPSSKYPSNKNPFEYCDQVSKISNTLYPDDSNDEGKLLRLKQQYLFSAAGVKSICRKHKAIYGTLENLHEKACFQLNDTHPTCVIPELMRILVDEENIPWEKAWYITSHACAYTNHTILAEALEKWPVHLFRYLLPRIYQIVEEINRRYCLELENRYAGDYAKISRMAIIGDNTVRMANLAIAGSYSVNGVAALHTQILKDIEMKDFNEFYPGKFNNKTNGITHRRWCYHSNPELVKILNEKCPGWVKDTTLLEKLLKSKNTKTVQNAVDKMKHARKAALAKLVLEKNGVALDPKSIFDIQVKRLHEYKRQLLNALHIMYVYNRLKNDEEFKKNYHSHSFIFGAKSAPGYVLAKKIIKLINTIAYKVNNDPETNSLLKVVFIENYNVTKAEVIMPAADLSEQISTASKEASGTGNMKFMMNGAVTIGTLDGANVEIGELVGDDNIIIFGMTAKEVTDLERAHDYNPRWYYDNDARIHEVVDQLTNGFFENVSKDEFQMIRDCLLNQDRYFVLKDFDSYVKAQEKANELYKNREKWLEMSIVNIAKSGFFSTDRTMEEYNNDIWHLEKIDLSK